MKKLVSVALICALMLSAMCFSASAEAAKTVVDGIRWFPCEPGRENDIIWEAECLKEGCGCQGFLENETTTGNKNFVDTVYGEDGSLTITRNGNDGEEFYWPRVRTLSLDSYPELDLKTANTLYFDFEANANWQIMLGINGMTIKLSKAIADAVGVSGIANSDSDGPVGTFKGSINLQDAIAEMASESGTESSAFAVAIQNMKTTYVPQVSIFVVGGEGASLKMNSLFISTPDDVNGDKCDYLDMGLIMGDEYYEQEDGTNPTDPTDPTDDTTTTQTEPTAAPTESTTAPNTTAAPDNTTTPTTAPTEAPQPVKMSEFWNNMNIVLEADKAEYAAGETIKVTLSAENCNPLVAVPNVSLESSVPQGFALKEGSQNTTAGANLAGGATVSLTAEYVPTAAPTDSTAAPTATTTVPNTTDAPKDVPKDVPKTGDTSNALLAIVIALGAAAAMIVAYKTGHGKQMLSVMLCLTLCFGMVAVVPVLTDAAQTHNSKTLSLTVKANGQDVVLTGMVSYGEASTTTTATKVTTSAPTTTTKASNTTAAKKEAIAQENARHEEEVTLINLAADENIEQLEKMIKNGKEQYGVSVIMSESYYDREIADIQDEMDSIRYQMMDTSKRPMLESVMRRLEEELETAVGGKYLATWERELQEAEAYRYEQLERENDLHEFRLSEIENQYA